MHYAALDIHKEMFFGTILTEGGNIIESRDYKNTKEALKRFLFIPPNDIQITIEACGMWRAYYHAIKALGYDVVLANPVKVKAIVKNKKTDKADSRALADLLRTGYLPKIYIPDEDVIRLRNIARHRMRLVKYRKSMKVTVKWLLLRDGIKTGRIWNKAGMQWLKSVNRETRHFADNIEMLNMHIKEVERDIRKISASTYLIALLKTIPGIADFSATLILAEIGDIKRFENPKSLVSYAGLCPGIYQSGNTSRSVRNTACDKYLKYIVMECAGRAVMLNTRYTRHYARVRRRKGKKVARRSVARRMMTDIWKMLSKEDPFRDHRDRNTPSI